MSLSQQSERPFDTQLPYLPQGSPTTGRTQPTTHYTNSPSPVVDTRNRSFRKAAPSPLQTSTTPTSPQSSATPTRSTFARNGSEDLNIFTTTKLTQSPLEEDRSPQERLDGLLASEKSLYKSNQSANPLTTENHSRYGRPLQDTNATPRSVSDPVLNIGGSSTSPTTRSPTMAATAPAHRVEMGRPPPRTSSIDSAISSISSGGHSYKASQDSKASNGPPDIGLLIQAAGSAEAVIQHLLKEKQSQAGQNAQLWRLVDKQRAMILGLNKDLERALKDKERYRKKLKEGLSHVTNPSPVDSTQGPPSEVGSANSEVKTGDSPTKEAGGRHHASDGVTESNHAAPSSPNDFALAPYPTTPPVGGTPGLANMVEAEHKMPSPTKHAFQQFNPDSPPLGFEASQKQRQNQMLSSDMPYNASVPPSRSLPSEAPRGPPPNSPPPPPTSASGPSVTVIEASPKVDRGSPKFPPPRKAPPAPLNLAKKIEASSHLRQASGAGDESDTDYDDILEVDEIPSFPERGRRKTREEDDRVREIAAAKEAEARSLSKKSSKGSMKGKPKSKSNTPKETTPMPLSPRPTIPISPPDAHMRALSPPDENAGSLAGILNASRSPPPKAGVTSPPLLSPGLPMSPRPMGMSSRTNSAHSSLASPPMSPRGMAAFPGAIPLSPRAPRTPIPLPPGTPMSIASPSTMPVQPAKVTSPQSIVTATKTEALPRVEERHTSDSPSPDRNGNVIYKGLVTDEYPDLLLPPNALPSIDVKVASSRLKPSRASLMFPVNYEIDPVFTLAVFARSDGKELWRVEKDSASLAQLDQILRQHPTYTAKAPDRSLFSGHAPAKVDARRLALDQYLDEVLNTELDTASALEICRYLSTNTMEPHAEDMTPSSDTGSQSPVRTGPGGRPLKNGYLTKRGKNFGGWKARFFVLDGPVFKYYESPGGPHLGAIKLQNAQIGKQQHHAEGSPSRTDGDDADNQYRHAFLILEPKRKDSSSLVRHVLCAESDQERDEWVEALLRYVDYKDDEDESSPGHGRKSSSGPHSHGRRKGSQGKSSDYDMDLRGVSYEATKPGNIPHGARSKNSDTPSPPSHGYDRDPMSMPHSQSMKSISGPKNAQVIQDPAPWGNKQLMVAPDEKIKQKKRSFFGFGSKPRPSTDLHEMAAAQESTTNLTQMSYDQHGPIRPVFGTPLAEAVKFNHPANVNVELPAVIYRCIEYLDSHNAASEEGIFRLSGSNIVIRQLRERFNTEGDINLVTDDQYYDIHAVASLLKLYLRELPTTILTRELHLEFIAVTELHDLNEKISALNGLVHRLPRANNILLKYLSGFLINIINHSDTNKMTVRNVGIVFSPTLNIPAPVFALFLQQYDSIFGDPIENNQSPVEVTVSAPPLSAEDIRSPRRQKFAQDLPTPAYNQQSFAQQAHGFAGFNTMAGSEYGSRGDSFAGTMHNEQQPTPKSKRRESSMFGMNMGLGQKKPSVNRIQEDSRLVNEESFFE
ncbi:hypothetical protein CJF31_00011156 [Rutstroemia sp. NJR-2017a BVV2]|nr:hypothetical protein CJF31_00011156 [Rutstroemia sp. NJR-2017a BVV2]